MGNNEHYSSAGEGTQRLDANQVVQWQTYGRVPEHGDLVDAVQAATGNELSPERLDVLQNAFSTRFEQIMNQYPDSIKDKIEAGQRITQIFGPLSRHESDGRGIPVISSIVGMLRRKTPVIGNKIAERVLLEDSQDAGQLKDGDIIESYMIPTSGGKLKYEVLFSSQEVGNKRIALTKIPQYSEDVQYDLSRYDLTSFEIRRIDEIQEQLEVDIKENY